MSFSNVAYTLQSLLLCLLLTACASGTRAPVVDSTDPDRRPRTAPVKSAPQPVPKKPAGSYVVKKGDTLYSIAWSYGYDYRTVADWNGIEKPYVIYPGQKIRLTPPARPARKKAQPLTPGPIVTRDKPAATPDKTTSAKNTPAKKTPVKKPPEKTVPLPVEGPITWSWPVQGKLVTSDTPISKKGIDITGKPGQIINAAGPGEVVYSGSGLLGYGRLIIIKHNDTYLSAYAHNKNLLVREGDRVATGQQIAHMGQTNNGRTLLHFEIRKNGKPVDPLDYLPKL